jgi:hypothetical protein
MAKRKGLLHSSTRVSIGRENPRRGGHYCKRFYTHGSGQRSYFTSDSIDEEVDSLSGGGIV